MSHLFVEPFDVLFMRGNKLFGDPGSFGESLMPPWPSVIAGALRSRMLVDDGFNLVAFAKGDESHNVLGKPDQPGRFTITAFHIARRYGDKIELLVAPPADLVIYEEENGPIVRRLSPTELPAGLQASSVTSQLALLAENKRGKPTDGYWLTQSGWKQYLNGATPESCQLISSRHLWAIDYRVGIGLNAATRSADKGKLFGTQAVAMKKREHGSDFDVGFLVTVNDNSAPKNGMIRLGGDGRAATLAEAKTFTPIPPDYKAIIKKKRCRIVLTSPGIFPNGWCIPGINNDHRFNLNGVKGQLVCASVPRAEFVSGWDLAKKCPKPAQRVAPTGSVYWIDNLEATNDALENFVATGLWDETNKDKSRRAEGFNRFTLAVC